MKMKVKVKKRLKPNGLEMAALSLPPMILARHKELVAATPPSDTLLPIIADLISASDVRTQANTLKKLSHALKIILRTEEAKSTAESALLLLANMLLHFLFTPGIGSRALQPNVIEILVALPTPTAQQYLKDRLISELQQQFSPDTMQQLSDEVLFHNLHLITAIARKDSQWSVAILWQAEFSQRVFCGAQRLVERHRQRLEHAAQEDDRRVGNLTRELGECEEVLKQFIGLVAAYDAVWWAAGHSPAEWTGAATLRLLHEALLSLVANKRCSATSCLRPLGLALAHVVRLMAPRDAPGQVFAELVGPASAWAGGAQLAARLAVFRGLCICLPPSALFPDLLLRDLLPFFWSAVAGSPDPFVRHLALQCANEALMRLHPTGGCPEDVLFPRRFEDEVAGPALEVVWRFWGDPFDGVAQEAIALFERVLEVYAAWSAAQPHAVEGAPGFWQRLVGTLLAAGWDRKGKWQALKVLLPRVGAAAVVAADGQFVAGAVQALRDATICSHALQVLELFLRRAAAELPGGPDTAADLMLPPLCAALVAPPPLCSHAATYAVPALLMALPAGPAQLATYIARMCRLAGRDPADRTSPLTTPQLRAVLPLLKAGRAVGQVDGAGLEAALAATGVAGARVLEAALAHADEPLRNEALELLCNSRQAGEPCTPFELDGVRRFLQMNLKTPLQGSRQRIVAQLTRFLTRAKLGLRRLLADGRPRGGGSKRKLRNDRVEAAMLRGGASVEATVAFVEWLANYLVAALVPSAAYSRTTLALELLDALVDIWGPDPSDRIPIRQSDEAIATAVEDVLFGTNTAKAVVGCLWDSFDNNRVQAWRLLRRIPPARFPLAAFGEGASTEAEQAGFLRLASAASRLVGSPRVRECDTGALLVRLLLEKVAVVRGWVPVFTRSGATCEWGRPGDDPSALVGQYCRGLLALLSEHVRVAKASLVVAATQAPMHGVLMALRYLLDVIDFAADSPSRSAANTLVSPSESWRGLIGELLAAVAEVAEVALTVVSDAAPEGFTSESNIPVPFNTNAYELGEGDDEEASEHDEIGQRYATPKGQLVAVCSWLSIKEVGLLLGTLVDRVPLPDPAADPARAYVSHDQLAGMGRLFLRVLVSTQHRGAIEKAHVGFQALAHVLCRARDPALYALPAEWLDVLFRYVTAAQTTYTRRSAGLPYAYAAILRAEAEALRKATKRLIPRVFEQLLQEAARPDGPAEPSLIVRVHCLNILKALFRDAALRRDTNGYVSRGMELALRGYRAAHWAIRNSSTMLFSTLLARTVGAKKTRDEHDAANAATFLTFFARFPALYPFLLHELHDAVHTAVPYPNLYPILVLLARLVPSEMDKERAAAGERIEPRETEGEEDDEDEEKEEQPEPRGSLPQRSSPEPFIPLLLKCTTSNNHKTRQMAARALVPLISSSAAHSFLAARIEETIPTSPSSVSFNTVHGTLLLVQYMFEAHLRAEGAVSAAMASQVVPLLTGPRLEWLATTHCSPVRALFTDLVTQYVLPRIEDGMIRRGWTQRAVEALAETGPARSDGGVGQALLRREIALTSLHAAWLDPEGLAAALPAGSVSAWLLSLLADRDYEVRKAVLKLLALRLPSSSRAPVDLAALWRCLHCDVLARETHHACVAWCFRLLRVLVPLLPESVRNSVPLKEQCRLVDQQYRTSSYHNTKGEAIVYMGTLVSMVATAPVNETAAQLLHSWQSYIDRLSRAEQSLTFRKATASSLWQARSLCMLEGEHDGSLEDAIVTMWRTAVRLLQDDDDDVRMTVAQMVTDVEHGVIEGPNAALERCFGAMTRRMGRSKRLQAMLWALLDGTEGTEGDLYGLFAAHDQAGPQRLFAIERDNQYAEPVLVAHLAAASLLVLQAELSLCGEDVSLQGAKALSRLSTATAWLRTAVSQPEHAAWTSGISFSEAVYLPLYLVLAVLFVVCRDAPPTMRADIAASTSALLTLPLHPSLLFLAAKLLEELSLPPSQPAPWTRLPTFYLWSGGGQSYNHST